MLVVVLVVVVGSESHIGTNCTAHVMLVVDYNLKILNGNRELNTLFFYQTLMITWTMIFVNPNLTGSGENRHVLEEYLNPDDKDDYSE
jgi:hypothetical protein